MILFATICSLDLNIFTPPRTRKNQFSCGGTGVRNRYPGIPPSTSIHAGPTDSRMVPAIVISFVTIGSLDLNISTPPRTQENQFCCRGGTGVTRLLFTPERACENRGLLHARVRNDKISYGLSTVVRVYVRAWISLWTNYAPALSSGNPRAKALPPPIS